MATEKRLIDANALIKQLWAHNAMEPGLTAEIEHCPTVDAVEAVRCKDCRWSRNQDHREPTDTPANFLICQCFMHHHIPAPWGARLAVKPDGFCSYGERRSDEN